MQCSSHRELQGHDQSILSIVNQCRQGIIKDHQIQQFTQKDYIKLKSSIIRIKKKYQSATLFQMQDNRNQDKQNLTQNKFSQQQASHNQFCKQILENYIEDIKKRKKIKILLNMQQNGKLVSWKQKHLRSLKNTVWSKCKKDQSFPENHFDYRFYKQNTVSKDQKRRNLPLQIFKTYKKLSQHHATNLLSGPISSRKNKFRTQVDDRQFKSNLASVPTLGRNLTSDINQMINSNYKCFAVANKSYYRSKKLRRIKMDNKGVQQLLIKKANMQNTQRQIQCCQKQRQKKSQIIIKSPRRMEQQKRPKKREQLFKIYSFLNKSGQKISLNRVKGLGQISNHSCNKQNKDSFEGWTRLNSIRQDADSMFF